MSPVLRAGIDTLAFMRMTSTSNPSCLKNLALTRCRQLETKRLKPKSTAALFQRPAEVVLEITIPQSESIDRLCYTCLSKLNYDLSLGIWKFDKGDCFG